MMWLTLEADAAQGELRKRSTKVVRQPIFLLLFSSIIHTPFALTLRGPSGGHCVELHWGGANNE